MANIEYIKYQVVLWLKSCCIQDVIISSDKPPGGYIHKFDIDANGKVARVVINDRENTVSVHLRLVPPINNKHFSNEDDAVAIICNQCAMRGLCE